VGQCPSRQRGADPQPQTASRRLRLTQWAYQRGSMRPFWSDGSEKRRWLPNGSLIVISRTPHGISSGNGTQIAGPQTSTKVRRSFSSRCRSSMPVIEMPTVAPGEATYWVSVRWKVLVPRETCP
jgi:hypothetical protein